MFSWIDETLEAFLRASVPLSAVDIDVSFVPPEEDWSAKLTRPTVNLHLWDVRRSATRAVTGVEQFERNGVAMRRLALPRAELRYVITAWTSDPGDERALLGATFVALLAHNDVPAGFLAEPLRELPSPTLNVARTGDVETKLIKDGMKLGLQLTVTAVVDTGAGTPLAAPVTGIDLGVTDTESGAHDATPRRIAGEVADPTLVGAFVTSPRGSATVNEAGRFLIRALPGDEIVVHGPAPITVVAPEQGGIRVGDIPVGST